MRPPQIGRRCWPPACRSPRPAAFSASGWESAGCSAGSSPTAPSPPCSDFRSARNRIATAKLVVYAAWAAGVSILLALGLLITGLATGLGAPDADAVAGLARQLALGLLTALIAVPAGWAASWGRGLLPGIAVTIGLLVVAQVSVLGGFASWLPLVAPAFWAMQPDAGDCACPVVRPVGAAGLRCRDGGDLGAAATRPVNPGGQECAVRSAGTTDGAAAAWRWCPRRPAWLPAAAVRRPTRPRGHPARADPRRSPPAWMPEP